MNKILLILGFSLAMGGLAAQEAAPASPAPNPAAGSARPFDDAQLDQLLGPIALYPDALIAIILPASTNSADVVLAARFLAGNGDAAQIESQSWDDSVRALAHYPEVVRWMDENLAWTKQLGEAFAAEASDVMAAVQRLRAKAQAVGSLVDTPQQQVVSSDNSIAIVPTQPDVIYVPYYDSDVVYSTPPYYGYPYFSFGPPCPVGYWLSFNLDWQHRRLWTLNHYDRERFWRDRNDFWRHPNFPEHPGSTNLSNRYVWSPRPSVSRPRASLNQSRIAVARPAPTFAARPDRVTSSPSEIRRMYPRSNVAEAPVPPAPLPVVPRRRLANPAGGIPATGYAPSMGYAPSPRYAPATPAPEVARPANPGYRSYQNYHYINRAPGEPGPSVPTWHPSPPAARVEPLRAAPVPAAPPAAAPAPRSPPPAPRSDDRRQER